MLICQKVVLLTKVVSDAMKVLQGTNRMIVRNT